ncbi:MAG: hypothetical protein ACD_3C00067G0026 [uncultured bacterium (gcode 4)]|uniref:ATP-cone domain-containing protein n=1 Tax=uncultured bacterium (gcode 4) TaxID=1234023 RepID=K2G2B0_9BACT|nr:MAG: hypothetical protein ACD_3C00067G0026 [uncultured bacterium (gcode 4)]
MAIYKVKKRNWAIVTFDRAKIETALKKAIEASGWKDFSEVPSLTDEILEGIEVVTGKNIPDIELIQDKVEEILIKWWHNTVAKNYILYRQKRSEARHDRDVVVEVGKTMDEYLDQTDWRVNANANSGYSLGWLILNVSWKVTANYWLSHVYPAEVGNAHRNWDYHIHDLDMFCWYCAGWSLRQLLEEWFNWAPNRIESSPPKNLQSAVNQMINFLGTLQNEWAWAQAFSSFDTYMAPYLHKFEEETRNDMEKYSMKFESEEVKEKYIEDKVYKYTYQNLQNFIFWLNVPSRWWTQTPFTNITLDWVCPEDLADKALYLGGYDKGPYKKKYSELKKEMDLINRVLIEIYTAWDNKWRVFTFPIPTYNITEDFDWDSSNTELLFEMTAKYWLPYFQNFIGSQFKREKNENGVMETVRNKDAYTPWAVRSMCCRLQLDLKELLKRWNWLFGSAEMTGSIWVVTINLARIGYNFKGDKEGLLLRIEHLMSMAKTSLELKREELTKWLDRWFYPYTFRYLKSFRNHFSTIGINGVNEAIKNFTDNKEDISTIEWMELAKEILEFMREKLKSYQEETGNLYNLEATPAEWTTYRFAREDKKQMADIIQAWTQEAPYYTNSSQLPVWFTDDAFEALEYQNELQCKYTWGTVLHLYMWERLSDSTACKNLVRKVIENYQLPYITISPTFSICPKHWYIAWEYDYCPKCDEDIWFRGQKLDIEQRVKYTDDPLKLEELRLRED